MADNRPCDFCGAPVVWTPEQVVLDAWLALQMAGGGLGVQCEACGDKEIAHSIAEMEREERREREENGA